MFGRRVRGAASPVPLSSRLLPRGAPGATWTVPGKGWWMVSRVVSRSDVLRLSGSSLGSAKHNATRMSTLIKILWKVYRMLLFSQMVLKEGQIKGRSCSSGKVSISAYFWRTVSLDIELFFF